MKKKIVLWSGLFLLSVSAYGCASATDIPEKKEDIIVDYMASVVLRHDANIEYDIEENILRTLPPPATLPPQSGDDVGNTPKPEEISTPKPEDTNKPDADNPGNGEVSDGVTTNNPSEVLGLSGIKYEFKNYKLYKSYSGGDYFTLEPEEGKQLMMVNISLTNTTDKEKKVTLSADMVDYEIEINGTDKYNPLMTVLDNDILYLDKKISAGKSLDTVLVFQVDEKTKIDTVKITMENDDEKYAQMLTK